MRPVSTQHRVCLRRGYAIEVSWVDATDAVANTVACSASWVACGVVKVHGATEASDLPSPCSLECTNERSFSEVNRR